MGRTNTGRDWQSKVMGDPASNATGAYATGSYIGLTADATTPSSSSTSLTGEINSGSLNRAIATFAHTTGTSSYTLTKTFTSDSTVTIHKIGIFNAATSGTLIFETLLNQPATLVNGDLLQITQTITL